MGVIQIFTPTCPHDQPGRRIQYWQQPFKAQTPLVVDRRLYGYGICFANVAFFEAISSTPLNGSLRNLAIEHYEETFGYRPPKNCGPETTYFRRLRNSVANLRATISGGNMI